jgi:hypothetical protein
MSIRRSIHGLLFLRFLCRRIFLFLHAKFGASVAADELRVLGMGPFTVGDWVGSSDWLPSSSSSSPSMPFWLFSGALAASPPALAFAAFFFFLLFFFLEAAGQEISRFPPKLTWYRPGCVRPRVCAHTQDKCHRHEGYRYGCGCDNRYGRRRRRRRRRVRDVRGEGEIHGWANGPEAGGWTGSFGLMVYGTGLGGDSMAEKSRKQYVCRRLLQAHRVLNFSIPHVSSDLEELANELRPPARCPARPRACCCQVVREPCGSLAGRLQA